CGNSLIDDPEVAGEKAFKWEEEFPVIMANGGFNVVIGNPPYGATLSVIERNYIYKYFECFNGNFDIYSAFIQLAFRLNKSEGYWGFIMPVSWQSGDSYLPVRKHLSEAGQFHIGIKLPYDTFQDAYIDTGIYIFNKKLTSSYSSKVFEFPIRFKLVDDIKSFLDFKLLPNHYWESLESYKIVLNPAFYELLPKVSLNSINLIDITKSVRGILPNNSDLFDKPSDNLKKYFVGNLYRYIYSENFSWVKYGPNLREYPKDYSFFIGERILIRRLISRKFRVMATLTSDEFVNKKDLYIFQSINEQFDNKYLLAIINSKLISYLKTKGSTTATKDDFSQLTLSDLRTIPIKECVQTFQNKIIENIDEILSTQNEAFLLIDKFVHFIQSRFNISKTSQKLLNFYTLSFQDFIGYLKKEKIQLSKKEEFELLEIFDEYVNEVNGLNTKVTELDNTIDEIIYDIYGLNPDEINIIENYLP
ncbi:MAG: Eco57I restriction-modification methylase domain-containing protein, partial [Calditrichales bacterium]|nr:Eco57I restriction-modification methylase domain-containing protein [Calditrichales bacterium]